MEDQTPDMEKNRELLQKEILDKNLNQEEFIAFCQKKKENGDDLANWTYEELSQVIAEFAQTAGKIDEEKAKIMGGIDDVFKSETIEQGMEQIESIDAQHKESGVPSTKKEIDIKCKTLEKSQLNNNAITCEVKNPRTEIPGILKNAYTLYEVNTQPTGWLVLRRYSDFDWLRKTLVKCFPGIYVPPIPHKKMGPRRLEEDYILKRMTFLNHFINAVLQNENFKASEALVCFLSYTQRDQFEQKMKEYTSMREISYIEDIRNLDSKVTLTTDESNKKYFVNIEKYFNFQTQILKKVTFNIKCFQNNLRDASRNLSCLSKNFELLFFLNNRVMMKDSITKTYEELQQFCDNWGKIFEKQLDAVQIHFKEFFKLLKLEGEAFQELVAKRTSYENRYTSEFQRIALKKDKLFNTKDVSKFEITAPSYDQNRILSDKTYAFTVMCGKDNNLLDSIEKFVQYYNKMSLTQLKTLVKQHCDRFYDNFKQFDAMYYPSINDVSLFILIFF